MGGEEGAERERSISAGGGGWENPPTSRRGGRGAFSTALSGKGQSRSAGGNAPGGHLSCEGEIIARGRGGSGLNPGGLRGAVAERRAHGAGPGRALCAAALIAGAAPRISGRFQS